MLPLIFTARRSVSVLWEPVPPSSANAVWSEGVAVPETLMVSSFSAVLVGVF